MSWNFLSKDQKVLMKTFISLRFFLLTTCMSLTILMICIQFMANKDCDCDLVKKAIENVKMIKKNTTRDARFTKVYRKAHRLPKDLKYMLLWTSREVEPLNFFGHGQRKFIEKNCSQINCYVTSNKYFFKGDTTKFDAIAFNGRMTTNNLHLPRNRSTHQIFIYFNMESADYFPVCSERYDNFFNWTSTYRLDSDVPFSYIQIRNLRGEVIGPQRNMKWLDSNLLDDEELEFRIQNKTKAVAWFVSNCRSRSRREDYVIQLQVALYPFGYSVDIYGGCGPLKCPRIIQDKCFSMLENNYYFYLSFENSFAEDYVTEKILTALQHTSVPIVLGGANYSRFLPPGSYINAGKMKPKHLASKIIRIMNNPKFYLQYFKWRSHYSYRDPALTDNVCAVCEALHNENKIKKIGSYNNFRKWWFPRYKRRCTL